MLIACIGNAAYDCTVSQKGFLKEGVRNSFDNAVFCTGGPASNAASVLAKFGNNVEFYGQIGNDVNGEFIYNQMSKENIDLRHLNISKDAMTPFSFIIINQNNATRTICSLRSKEDFSEPKIHDIVFDTKYDYILTDGKYANDSIDLILKNPQAKSILDAGRVNDNILRLANYIDYIICSEDFSNEVTKMTIDEDLEKTKIIFKNLKSRFKNIKELAITIGQRGYICEKDGEVINMPAYDHQSKTIDTNGAGDIFHGAFTHAMANGYGYHESLEFANITASLSTTKRGGRTSVPTLEEVEQRMKKPSKKLVKTLK